MNASQRRQARRVTLSILPLQSQVITPSGSTGRVVGTNNTGRTVDVKLKNNRVSAYPLKRLGFALAV